MDEIVEASPSPKSSTSWKPVISAPSLVQYSNSIFRHATINSTTHDRQPEQSERGRTRKRPLSLSPLGHPTGSNSLNPVMDPCEDDDWLPITESRNGNACSAAFHLICSGFGIQALLLPVAFAMIGWTWGIICFSLVFTWQLYTIYLLVQLHESTETGIRYSRYLQLSEKAFGKKVTSWLISFPITNLPISTCIALTIIGGANMNMLFEILCGVATGNSGSPYLSPVEWHLVFTTGAVILSQLPNLSSFSSVSLIGSIAVVGYSTLLWAASIVRGRVSGISYSPLVLHTSTPTARGFDVMMAIGLIVLSFRGHNLILEIQATMPSSDKDPSHVPMWKGVKLAYLVIGLCVFSLAVGGYWAYGNKIIENGGIMASLYVFHGNNTSQLVFGLISLFIVVSSVSSFQINAMPMFDMIESEYTTRKKRPCSWWLRAVIRVMFGYSCFFMAVAISFSKSLGLILEGSFLPLTLAIPCFMWIKIKKPKAYTPIWWLNWMLSVLGIAASVSSIGGGVVGVIHEGFLFKFFKPSYN